MSVDDRRETDRAWWDYLAAPESVEAAPGRYALAHAADGRTVHDRIHGWAHGPGEIVTAVGGGSGSCPARPSPSPSGAPRAS